MTKENGHPKAAQESSNPYLADLSAEAQRARLLDCVEKYVLMAGGVSHG